MSAGGALWCAALAAALAAALLLAPRPRLVRPGVVVDPVVPDERGWLQRHRLWWSLLGGCGALVLVGGATGLVAAPVATVAVWVVAGRAEPPAVRRRREAVARDLPHLVGLLGSAVRAGQAPGPALALVCEALPGPAADRLGAVAPRLAMGVDPAEVWAGLAADPELAPLGRALARAHESGSPLASVVGRLGEELAAAARAEVEDRARRVGVRAAVPLGLCLLPAFVLLGIVPLVAGLVASLDLG